MSTPKKRLVKKESNGAKFRCEYCGILKRARTIVYFKGRWLCGICKKKRESFKAQESAMRIGKPHISLEEALEKTYTVIGYTNKNGRRQCIVSFPSILAEKKFKILLVEE